MVEIIIQRIHKIEFQAWRNLCDIKDGQSTWGKIGASGNKQTKERKVLDTNDPQATVNLETCQRKSKQ